MRKALAFVILSHAVPALSLGQTNAERARAARSLNPAPR
jgi:hypothetical protein